MIRKHALHISFFLLSLLVYFVCTPNLAYAQTGTESASTETSPTESPINLTISPVTLSLETLPAVPVQAAIKIRNNSSEPENLTVSFGTFRADASGQKPQLIEPSDQDTYMSWLTTDTPRFTVQPGEWQTVTVTFAPPADAALSYYYTVIVNRQDEQQEPGATVIKGAPAVLLLTTVSSPHTKKSLELTTFSAQKALLDFLPQTFDITIKNTGNVHAVPLGNIFIDGQGKKDLAVLTINSAYSAVLPDSTRTLQVTWDDGFPTHVSGNQDQQSNGFKLGSTIWDVTRADRFRFGKYTAHLLMVYDNGERDIPVESFVSFWVIPWQLMLAAAAIFCLVLVGLWSVLKNVWRILPHRSKTS